MKSGTFCFKEVPLSIALVLHLASAVKGVEDEVPLSIALVLYLASAVKGVEDEVPLSVALAATYSFTSFQ